MDMTLFLRGLVIGFSIAAPVGPIGVLCIRRTLADGRVYGFISGLGAATADAFFGTIAALGLTIVSNFLVDQRGWLSLIGGGYLLYLGYKTFRAEPAERPAEVQARGLIGTYLSTLFLTLTNPLSIFAFAAIFAGLGASTSLPSSRAASALFIVPGVFGGSAAWWLILATATSMFRSKLNATGLRGVNRVSGTLIAVFGVAILYSLVAQA